VDALAKRPKFHGRRPSSAAQRIFCARSSASNTLCKWARLHCPSTRDSSAPPGTFTRSRPVPLLLTCFALQHPNYWQRSAPWATGLLDASASRQTDSVSAPRAQTQAVNGSSARPSDSAPQTSVPAASSTAVETATPPIQVLDRPGGPPSLVAQNPGRTIYSQAKPQPQ
jgi:hypothetical protein